MRAPLARYAAIACAALPVGAAAACEDTTSYVYIARKYDAANACLADETPIEVVHATTASPLCPPACLTVGDDLYVSTLCPPVPSNATEVPSSDPGCAAALDAAARGASCSAPPDASDDAMAGDDAASADGPSAAD